MYAYLEMWVSQSQGPGAHITSLPTACTFTLTRSVHLASHTLLAAIPQSSRNPPRTYHPVSSILIHQDCTVISALTSP
ncbi:hypothetical protein Pmani_038959 [Petrolisthes manimaculis]|uniref:Uncharacterized protein n=1 Tax=Petrolisthes manimaculis TaxID=1843537 RepID=A0AAE1TLU8_9EUCA|nr:hypothetical protein Pmani_038959 [Petrolisthes manimaculis]